MKPLLSNTWANAIGALALVVILWALFVAPAGVRWTGYLGMLAAAVTAAAVSVVYAILRPVPSMRSVVDAADADLSVRALRGAAPARRTR